MSTVKEGSKTTEFQVMNQAKWLGVVTTIIGLVELFAQKSDNQWAGVVLAVVGAVTVTLSALGYNVGRVVLKKENERQQVTLLLEDLRVRNEIRAERAKTGGGE